MTSLSLPPIEKVVMNFSINDIFPISFLRSNIESSLSQQELDAASYHLSEGKYHSNAGNHVSVDSYVLHDARLERVKNFIDDGVKNYVNSIIIPKNNIEFYVTQSWFNYTKPGQFHHRHNHPNSILSGVFYFNADPEKDKIQFSNDIYRTISIPAKEWTIRNSKTWWVPVATGDLIIFPSYLEHMVEQTVSDETRISLAFNTFAKGYFGDEVSNTALHLR
jgi:uncharacterized protein (TIGR02466 family)